MSGTVAVDIKQLIIIIIIIIIIIAFTNILRMLSSKLTHLLQSFRFKTPFLAEFVISAKLPCPRDFCSIVYFGIILSSIFLCQVLIYFYINFKLLDKIQFTHLFFKSEAQGALKPVEP
jgi:hypothetical protein